MKSRDLHWGLLATRDHKDINLSSLRSVLVADGANPWSLSSCDQFTAAFQSKGLRPDALCPCAGSSETGTISLRRYIILKELFEIFSSLFSRGLTYLKKFYYACRFIGGPPVRSFSSHLRADLFLESNEVI